MADETNNATGAAPAAPTAPDPAALQQELVRERFETVAAKAGLDESVVDLVAPAAHAWLEKNGRAGTKADIAEFMTELRQSKPKLFAVAAPAPAAPAAPATRSTAPVMPNAQPAAPAAALLDTPFARWQALIAAGRTYEAEGYYRANRRAIARTSG